MKTRNFLVAVGLVLLLFGCVTTGPGGKTSFILISPEQEVAIGQGMAVEVAATEKTLADQSWQGYLNEIGQKLAAVSDRPGLDYHFTVIESDQINAFAAPGGYIYFYTGLLKLMDNEAELAAVVSHEISHVVARHSVKRLQAALGVGMALDLAGAGEQSQIVQLAVQIGLTMASSAYSREHEREADEYGLMYMVEAGYDPAAMITMFEKLVASGSPSNAFEQLMSSHPDALERINNARADISRLGAKRSGQTLGRDRYQTMVSRLK